MGGSEVVKRHDAAVHFAHKHDLVYFHTINASDDSTPVIRGMTSTPDQVDSNFCIGSHDGYDMTFIERAAEVEFLGFESTFHYWYVLEIDLKVAKDLPFIFVGTKQLPKAFYAKVLTSRRNVQYIHLPTPSTQKAAFHGSHAIITSPVHLSSVYSLFTPDVVETLAAHKQPFAIEIEGDSLILVTEAKKPSEQLMNKLLHHGLWLAKLIDERMN